MKLVLSEDKLHWDIHYDSDYELSQLKISLVRTIRNTYILRKKRKGWNGEVNYLLGSNRIRLGLWNEVQRICKKHNMPFTIDGLKDAYQHIDIKIVEAFALHLSANYCPHIIPRKDQIDALHKLLIYRNCLADLGTSAGKTFIIFMYVLWGIKYKYFKKVLVICHDADSVIQFDAGFREYSGNGKIDLRVALVYGGSKFKEEQVHKYRVVVGNFQALQHKTPEFFENFDCIVVDECVAGYSELNTLDGPRLLKDVNVGDFVQAADSSGNIVYDRVINKWDKGERKVYTLELDNGYSVDCTGNHRIFTNVGWLTVYELLSIDLASIVCYTSALSIEQGRIYKESRIKQILKKDTTKVYDIETESTHTFFANGILVHNCQKATNNTIQTIIKHAKHATDRLGLSGTIQEDKTADHYTLLQTFGPIVARITQRELMNIGAAADIQIRIINMVHQDMHEKMQLYANKQLILGDETHLQDIDLYKQELRIIRENNYRLKWIGKFVAQLKGNTLVLFTGVTFDYGRMMLNEVKSVTNEKECYYIDGTVDTDSRVLFKDRMEEGENKVLFATYQTFGTGKSIKNLRNIVLAEPMKGFTIIFQVIGRGMRLHKDKDGCVMYDLCDDLSIDAHPFAPDVSYKSILYKQKLARMKLYVKGKHPCKATSINLPPNKKGH